ncbi:MAG: hypothetical protein DKINENOH_05583 [bacterium]|nr:hypothetical protein [bacterium]
MLVPWRLQEPQVSLGLLLQILVFLVIVIGGGMLAKIYFQKAKVTKEDRETWKKNAISHNKRLDEALTKKDDKAYGEFLHPKASRFQPKLPFRIDGSGEVLKRVKSQMEQTIGATSVIHSSGEVYREVLLVTYNYMTEGKLGEKFVEGSGKVTRVWVYENGWKLVHEHMSEN